jgi:polysaccharide export outer membrane protein
MLTVVMGLGACFPVGAIAQQRYVLGPQDVVEVVVFGNTEISRTVTVRPDGIISLPLIGEVEAAGLTPDQLRQRLTVLIAAYVREPRVAVIVREFRRIRIAVLGEVTRPGVYDLPQGSTFLDALAAAGGLAPDAGLGEARLTRGQEPPRVVDLERLLLQGDLLLNYALEPGDALIVPQDGTARIYVLGEVAKPGVLPLRGSLTALQALTLAGGPTRRALLSRTQVIRRARQAAPTAATTTLNTVVVAQQSSADIRVLPVDLLKVIEEGDVARDLLLRRGDILFVPENPVALDNIALLLGVAGNAALLLRR